MVDPEKIESDEAYTHILEIRLMLEEFGIIFEPTFEENEFMSNTVRNIIKGWINEIFYYAVYFHYLFIFYN